MSVEEAQSEGGGGKEGILSDEEDRSKLHMKRA
jgi:hypothetical protein